MPARPALLLALLAAAARAAAPAPPAWAQVNDFVYQLQNVNLTALGKTKFDLAIIDPVDNDGRPYAAEKIAALRNSPGGPKRVLAYLSIGEAEDYRPYWQANWDADHDGKPDRRAPAWLGPVNPDWPGNYAVRFWDPAWQKIILKRVDEIEAQGFDGVYLDLVDAFETWGPDGNNERPAAAEDMVAFVKSIAVEGRVKHADFAVVPQNAEALGKFKSYLKTITAIGHEDVFFDGDAPNDAGTVKQLVADLDRFKAAGRPVWIIDYPRKGKNVNRVYTLSKEHGYVAYCPSRALDVLTINAGHEPD